MLIGIVAGVVIASSFKPRHSRYISARDRRRAIAQFERDGERYDPKKHEVGHEVRTRVEAENLRQPARDCQG